MKSSDWVFLSVATCALCCAASSMQATVKNEQDWQLLEEFEFGEGIQVEFEYNATFPTSYAPTYLLFYKRDQYLKATTSNEGPPKTCEERQSILQESTAVWSQTQVLQRSNINCTWINDASMGEALWCQGRVSFPGVEERKWFIVVSRCGNLNNIRGVDFRYFIDKVMLTTTQPSTTTTMAFYPSGQSEVTYSTLTLASTLMLRQCFA